MINDYNNIPEYVKIVTANETGDFSIIDEKTYRTIIENDHLELVKWLETKHSQNKWNELLLYESVKGGKLAILKWLYDRNRFFEYRHNFCGLAAENGHIEVVKWLKSLDPPCLWDKRVYLCAINGQYYDIIRFARNYDPPCPYDSSVCEYAVNGGNIEVLKVLREIDSNGNPLFPWNEWVIFDVIEKGDMNTLKWIMTSYQPPKIESIDECYRIAIDNNRKEMITWLRNNTTNTIHNDINAFSYAIEKRNIKMIEYLRSTNNDFVQFQWDERVCYLAAIYGYVEILKWLRSQNPPCPWNKKDCISAATNDTIKNWILSANE